MSFQETLMYSVLKIIPTNYSNKNIYSFILSLIPMLLITIMGIFVAIIIDTFISISKI